MAGLEGSNFAQAQFTVLAPYGNVLLINQPPGRVQVYGITTITGRWTSTLTVIDTLAPLTFAQVESLGPVSGGWPGLP